MTLEEQERRAYADGQTKRAALLRLAIDVETEKVLDADYEIRSLKDDIRSLESRLSEWES